MAPINDNYANATLIAGDHGYITGSNFSASCESGEPHCSSSVWYKWIATSNDTKAFYTAYAKDLAYPRSPLPLLRSALRIYSGSALSGSVEQPYNVGTYIRGANGWDIGSYVLFTPISSSLYNIQICSAPYTGSALQGNFTLGWGTALPQSLGSCSSCPPTLPDSGHFCLGTVQPDVTNGNNSANFMYSGSSTIPQGNYAIKYCGGVFQFSDVFNSTQNPAYTAYFTALPQGSPPAQCYYQYNYMSGSPAAPTGSTFGAAMGLNENIAVAVASRSFQSANLAQQYFNQFKCNDFQFVHTGGPISVQFFDLKVSDNKSGMPSPSYGLYQLSPEYSVTACASWTTIGSAATVTYQITNNLNIPTFNVTASILPVGGITSPSAPVKFISFAPNQTEAATFTFNTSTLNISSSMGLSSPFFAPVTTSVYLAPIFISMNPSTGDPFHECLPGLGQLSLNTSACSFRCYNYNLALGNIGQSTPGPLTVDVSMSNGMQFMTGSCSKSNTVHFPSGTVHGNGFGNNTLLGKSCDPNGDLAIGYCSHNTANVIIVAPTVTTNTVMSVHIVDATNDYGIVKIPLTVSP